MLLTKMGGNPVVPLTHCKDIHPQWSGPMTEATTVEIQICLLVADLCGHEHRCHISGTGHILPPSNAMPTALPKKKSSNRFSLSYAMYSIVN